jgi:hypothetical protein
VTKASRMHRAFCLSALLLASTVSCSEQLSENSDATSHFFSPDQQLWYSFNENSGEWLEYDWFMYVGGCSRQTCIMWPLPMITDPNSIEPIAHQGEIFTFRIMNRSYRSICSPQRKMNGFQVIQDGAVVAQYFADDETYELLYFDYRAEALSSEKPRTLVRSCQQ